MSDDEKRYWQAILHWHDIKQKVEDNIDVSGEIESDDCSYCQKYGEACDGCPLDDSENCCAINESPWGKFVDSKSAKNAIIMRDTIIANPPKGVKRAKITWLPQLWKQS